jgi:hypothetical protein
MIFITEWKLQASMWYSVIQFCIREYDYSTGHCLTLVEFYGKGGRKQAKKRKFHKEILHWKKLNDVPIDTDAAYQVKISELFSQFGRLGCYCGHSYGLAKYYII